MSFRASHRRVETRSEVESPEGKSTFKQISPLRVPKGRFGRNDGWCFLQSTFIKQIAVIGFYRDVMIFSTGF
jgi:hypothetical protein